MWARAWPLWAASGVTGGHGLQDVVSDGRSRAGVPARGPTSDSGSAAGSAPADRRSRPTNALSAASSTIWWKSMSAPHETRPTSFACDALRMSASDFRELFDVVGRCGRVAASFGRTPTSTSRPGLDETSAAAGSESAWAAERAISSVGVQHRTIPRSAPRNVPRPVHDPQDGPWNWSVFNRLADRRPGQFRRLGQLGLTRQRRAHRVAASELRHRVNWSAR